MSGEDSNLNEEDTRTRCERPLRTKVLKGAMAAFNLNHSAVPCLVRDLSSTGAKLEFEIGWIVPNNFTLFVDIDGFKVDCEMVWHRERLFGVRFTSEMIPIKPTKRQHIKLYKSDAEIENVSLSNIKSDNLNRNRTFRAFGRLK